MSASETPLVSVIVLGGGQAEVVPALASVARQDYPAVETIVVGGTDDVDRHLPHFRPGHVVRTFDSGRCLPRARAANVGLSAAQGEWLCFLGANGAYDDDFISAMVNAAAGDHRDALVVYGRTRIFRSDGKVDRLFGRPFNRALIHYEPLFCWQAALIRRSAVGLGCRFDEAMEVCEEQDFLAQIAEHSDFTFVPVVASSYRANQETLAAADARPDVARTIRFERLLRAKTAGAGAYHNRRASRLYMRAIGASRAGDRSQSRLWFDALLKEYPDDPDDGYARAQLQRRLPEHADTLAGRTLDIEASAAEHPPRSEVCVGRAATEPPSPDSDRIAQQAGMLLARGEALRAKALVDELVPADLGDPETSRTAGEICLELQCLEQAYAFLDRSARLMPSARVEELLTDCCDLLWRDRARASAHALVLRMRKRIEKRATAHRSPTRGPIHVLGTLGTIGGSETRAASLYRALSPHVDVRLWSTVPPPEAHYPGLPIQVLEPSRGAFPTGGTLILAGQYFDCGDWWRDAAFDRVVICVNVDRPLRLVQRLTDIEESKSVAHIDFTFASRLSRDIFGLPGEVEYSFADVTRFAPAMQRDTRGHRLSIGRHSRDVWLKHHPNDPALYRELVARGHRLRLLGGTCLQAAFAHDSAMPEIALLGTASEDPRDFLSGLDCFIYRKHPRFLETGCAAILEAMAMALPTIVFRDGVGAAEIIQHGHDGFLVNTEAEALACIDRLAADPDLRAAIGSAARRKVSAVMQEQQRRILAYYLGPR